jgi:trans-aconitate methyltransferase
MTQTDWNASLYDQKHAFVFNYGESLLNILAPQAGEHILDIGCGTGHLTAQIAASGAKTIGVDKSASMVATAQQKYPEIDFRVMDATQLSFDTPFDALFSNAALHWIPQAEQVVMGMARVLKSGGRLVIEMGGHGNVETIVSALQETVRTVARREITSGWYFPSLGSYAWLLEQHGFAVQSASLFDRPTPFEGEDGLRNWIVMFGPQMLQQIPTELHEEIIARTEMITRPKLFHDGQWIADYRRLRITAIRQ